MTDEPAEIAHSVPLAVAPERPVARTAATWSAVRRGWILWLAAVVPAAAGLLLLAGSLNAPIPESYGFRGFTALFAVTFASVGAIVVARRPGNRVGLLLTVVGIIAGVQLLATEYANAAPQGVVGGLPGAIWAAWLGSWIWVPFVALAGPTLLLIYPDGRLASPRWRPLAYLLFVLVGANVLLLVFRRGPLENFTGFTNPLGVISIGTVVEGALLLSLLVPILGAAASVVVRYRSATREVRQQLKWMAVSGVLLALLGPLGFVSGKAGQVVFILALCGIPLAAGIAVLRYGLYEIDTIINRALVYGLLTAILAGLYTASVGLMQRVSKAATGADSDAAIVLTTLIVVTAFTPVKNRLQRLVDQRFKENRDPATRLGEFVAVVRDALSPLDVEKTLRRFLRVVVEAGDLPGGRIELDAAPERAWSASVGEEPVEGKAIVLSAPFGAGTVRLVVNPPERTGALSARDRAAMAEALGAIVDELSLPAPAPAHPSRG